MKIKIFFATIIVSCIVASCASPTQITDSWRDPDVSINPRLHKIVVAALLYDQYTRREVEDYMSSIYRGEATQSYLIFGDSLVTDANGESQKLKDLGYDGVVIMKQADKNVSQYYVPGSMPGYYSSWGGYWGYGWGGWGGPRWGVAYYPGSPGYEETEKTFTVQVNVYSLTANKLVWSATTETTDPGGRVPLYVDVCRAVKAKMKHEGFLR
ncbi:MAG TPA: hypothetical protein VK718_05335 [Ferruginibacter sp.]|jgi:hypothetical protein|nr:hypothetical protein [Ferruginibacter sp.]